MPADIEEERRLFYVGVTRAKDLLYITRPKRRTQRGRVVDLTPSRFLEGLPEGARVEYQSAGSQELASEEVSAMALALLDKIREK